MNLEVGYDFVVNLWFNYGAVAQLGESRLSGIRNEQVVSTKSGSAPLSLFSSQRFP